MVEVQDYRDDCRMETRSQAGLHSLVLDLFVSVPSTIEGGSGGGNAACAAETVSGPVLLIWVSCSSNAACPVIRKASAEFPERMHLGRDGDFTH